MDNCHSIYDDYVEYTETTLTLLNLNRHQSGIYQCVVRNGYGTDFAHARLTVNEASSTTVTQSTTATSDDHQTYNTPSYSFDGIQTIHKISVAFL